MVVVFFKCHVELSREKGAVGLLFSFLSNNVQTRDGFGSVLPVAVAANPTAEENLLQSQAARAPQAGHMFTL